MTKRQLVVATHNRHKVAEIRAIFAGTSIGVDHLGRHPGVPTAPETGDTFAANALEKALFACRYLQKPCCADDSGIGLSALGGAPGVRSARFAGEDASDEENNALLLKQMRDVDDRTAFFAGAVALVVPRSHIEHPEWSELDIGEWFEMGDEQVHVWIGEASVFGTLTRQPLGSEGFGYDPLFLYGPAGRTFAQMSMEDKNEISHRGRALRMLARTLM